MKKIILISIAMLGSCAKQSPIYDSTTTVVSHDEMEASKTRNKNLNSEERHQIQEWIKSQDKKYYPMGMNYWVDIENLASEPKKNDGEKVSYTYDIYDFDMVKLYENAKQIKDQELGKFDDLRPVEDAVRHMKKGSEATLLIPSALAFGSYGDNDKISSDMPIIVKIKTL